MAKPQSKLSGLERQLEAALEEKIEILSNMLEPGENDDHPMRFLWRAERRKARDQLATLRDEER